MKLPPPIRYEDGNGWLSDIAPGTLCPAPEVGSGFYSATRPDGVPVIIFRSQLRFPKEAASQQPSAIGSQPSAISSQPSAISGAPASGPA